METYSRNYLLSPDNRLKRARFNHPDILNITDSLIGEIIVTQINGALTAGRLVELEAYAAPEDLASHARNNTRTPRTETFWSDAGSIYMYICYGIHNMVNIITGDRHTPHAILIRAIEPVYGMDIMQQRRGKAFKNRALAGGPGRVAQCLGLDKSYNDYDAISGKYIRFVKGRAAGQKVETSPRIGIDPVPEPWKSMPYRFTEPGNKYLSRP